MKEEKDRERTKGDTVTTDREKEAEMNINQDNTIHPGKDTIQGRDTHLSNDTDQNKGIHRGTVIKAKKGTPKCMFLEEIQIESMYHGQKTSQDSLTGIEADQEETKDFLP